MVHSADPTIFESFQAGEKKPKAARKEAMLSQRD
jgi:hypothetical protein